MIKISVAAITLLTSQTNAMDIESNAMDIESNTKNLCTFAHEYENNFKELEKQRSQQKITSFEDPYQIRYWVFNQLDTVIPVTTHTATAKSTLFNRDNATNHSITEEIPKKHFTFLSDINFFQLKRSLKDKNESKDPFFPTPRVDFDSCMNTFFMEDDSKQPFGSIFIISKPDSNDFTSSKIETISFYTIMNIFFNTDENSNYGLIPKEIKQIIGLKYLELKIELPKIKVSQIGAIHLSEKKKDKEFSFSPHRLKRRAGEF